jgi:site-specific recombinase XerD
VPAAGSLAALEPLVEAARGYAKHAKAPNTRRAYAADWKTFEAWCTQHRLQSLPAPSGVIATYLADLAKQGRKPATIRRALSGIAHGHTSAGYPWAKNQPTQVRDVLSGIDRTGEPARKKAPIGVMQLAALVARASARDRAIVLLGWAGAFRRTELVALNIPDVVFTPEGLTVRVVKSKTDQKRKGAVVGVTAAEKDPRVCPVRAVREYLAWRLNGGWGAEDGALFLNPRGERLSDHSVALVVKRLAARAGLDAATVAAHSLRSGFATSAAGGKKSLDAIMRQGRWKNVQTVLGYVRPATVFDDNAGKGLL